MGMGDELLVSGIAKRIHAMTNQSVSVLDANGNPRQCDLWNGLSYIYQNGMGQIPLVNGPSVRQYYHGMAGNRILWRKWDIAPGEIRLTADERKWALGQFTMGEQHPRFIVLNPDFKEKGGGGANKNWGMQRWWEVARELKDTLIVQLIPPGNFTLIEGCVPIHTETFRHACAILERSIGYVGHEGGLHHAAAALGKPAVVVFGGYISPEVTGYPGHTNLYTPDERYPLGCGDTAPCNHCRAAMDKITVEQVVEAVRKMVNDGHH